jgi:hypothetical protein
MSGLAEAGVVEHVAAVNRGGFLAKPFTSELLLRAVRGAIDTPVGK